MRNYLPLFIIMFLCSFIIHAEENSPIVTVSPANIEPLTVKPGSKIKITYTFHASQPTKEAMSVFVHILNEKGGIAFQMDHNPVIKTDSPKWNGTVSYTKEVTIPKTTVPGKYEVAIGFYKKKSGRMTLNAGEGVKVLPGKRYIIGTFIVE